MKTARNSLFAILLITIIFISGCVSKESPSSLNLTNTDKIVDSNSSVVLNSQTEPQKFVELKTDAKNLNNRIAYYRGINSDLNLGYTAYYSPLNSDKSSKAITQSATSALSYFQSARDKAKALNYTFLEQRLVVTIITKFEQSRDSGNYLMPSDVASRISVALVDLTTDFDSRCVLLSNKITSDHPAELVSSRNEFTATNQKLKDILSTRNYASALNKSKDFGDPILTNILDELVTDFKNHKSINDDIIALHSQLIKLRLNACQNLVNDISNI